MNLARFTRFLQELDVVTVSSDFAEDQLDAVAVDTAPDGGAVEIGDEVNGVVTFTPSDGTVADNDEAYLATPNEIFRFGTNREIFGRFKFRFTEVAANRVNVAVGFQNAVGANSILDDGAGLKTSGSCLGIYKADGSDSLLRVVSACNGAAAVTVTNYAVAAATDYVAEIHCKDWDGVSMQVTYKFGTPANGLEFLKDANYTVVRHTVPIANSTEMQMFAGVKLGAAGNNDTLKLDYWYAAQTRV